ncbi:MAG: hypothetical protein HQ471_09370 [Flavobacteriales bacterium]|nr:hypothetical protein [Flavobacteriales bacterium]
MSATGNVLLLFRDFLIEWIPILIGNTLVISSTVVLLIGFEQFTNKKGTQVQNYLLIFIFFLVHSYFTFIKPDLSIRNLDISIFYLLISAQIGWLMLVRVPKKNREITRGVGIVFCLLFVVQSARLFVIIFHEQQIDSYFNLDNSEGFFLLSYEFILIVMTYTISLMYNKRLIIDVKEQEKINTRLYAENLQLELNLKNKELSQKALNIASMKEFNKNILSEIKDDISGIENSNIQKTIKKLTNISQKEKIWQEFDDRFKEANSEFYKKILADYSNLSTNQIRVAYLIRQNHTTKEIAEILQRSPKTIENSRSRLRKEMNLQQEANLAKFLRSIK